MITLSAGTPIFLCVTPADMRKGIDGLGALCRQKLLENPLEGAVFVFSNRRHTQIRLLYYDGQGFWLCTKRLSQGTFRHWPHSSEKCVLKVEQLSVLVRGGDPFGFNPLPDWRMTPK